MIFKKIDNYLISINNDYKNKEKFLYEFINEKDNKNNKDSIVNKLLSCYKYYDICNYCIYNAVYLNKYELVETFIKYNFTHHNNDIMLIACKNENLDILKLLVNYNFYKCGNCLTSTKNIDIIFYMFDNNFPYMENEIDAILNILFENILDCQIDLFKKNKIFDIINNNFASHKKIFFEKLLIDAIKTNDKNLIITVIKNEKNNTDIIAFLLDNNYNIDEDVIREVFYSDHTVFSFEQLSRYNCLNLYKHKLSLGNKCNDNCKCLDNCNTDSIANANLISFILNNNSCLYSVKLVLNVVQNHNELVFNNVISKINRFKKNENLLYLIENINDFNSCKILLFIETVLQYSSANLYLDDKHAQLILNLNNVNIIKSFLYNPLIIVKNKTLKITNEKYDIYKLIYDNNCFDYYYYIDNTNETNDYIDIKAYYNKDIAFLEFCLNNKCSKNIAIIDSVINDNDINTLTLLYDNYYNFDNVDIDLVFIKSQEIFSFLITKIKKFDTIKYFIYLIKNCNGSCDKYILDKKNKDNSLISLFASKYNEVLFEKIIDNDFSIHSDCILYICEKKKLVILQKLSNKICDLYLSPFHGKLHLSPFHGIMHKYRNLLCNYFTDNTNVLNILTYNNILTENNTLFDSENEKNINFHTKTENLFHYLLKHVDENNFDLYCKIFHHYKNNFIYHHDIIEIMVNTNDPNKANMLLFLLITNVKFNNKTNSLLQNVKTFLNVDIFDDNMTIDEFFTYKNMLTNIFDKSHDFPNETATCIICLQNIVANDINNKCQIYNKPCACNYLIDVSCANNMKNKKCVYKCGMTY